MFENINTTENNNQALRANIDTFIPSTLERILGIPRIYQTVANVKLHFSVHQVQDMYILHLPYFKFLLLFSYGHEYHILPNTRKRRS